MTGETRILAIDQGTTSTRAMLFDAKSTVLGQAQRELPQIFPDDGWVEHDPEEIWRATVDVCRRVLTDTGSPASDIDAIGITNQRETTVLWDRRTGDPLHNAIVWQDRRTADFCESLRAEGLEEWFQAKTGLLLDPYFSGTKLRWLLDNVEDARSLADQGHLAFGTIDSWLIYKLTGGASHVTDATNASRTLLFNIGNQCWDSEILSKLEIPESLLPQVLDCADDFGVTDPEIFGASLPICGVAGDQQAATIGQACFSPGMMKSTYGTGCFALLNTGSNQVTSENRLLGTVAYRLGGEATYAVEGSIFMAGATIQWVRDGLGLIASSAESEALAKTANPESNVYLVPAFTGLGAPYWDPHARGSILGMTRDSGRAEIVRAAIESVSYQTRDLMEAMSADMMAADMQDGFSASAPLRVDGGMVANDWFVQNLADVLGRPVERPKFTETTALGAAFLAGLQQGIYGSLDDLAGTWALDARFEPQISADERDQKYAGWKRAVGRVLTTD